MIKPGDVDAILPVILDAAELNTPTLYVFDPAAGVPTHITNGFARYVVRVWVMEDRFNSVPEATVPSQILISTLDKPDTSQKGTKAMICMRVPGT